MIKKIKYKGIAVGFVILSYTAWAQAPNDNIGSGNSLNFDGVNDYAQTANTSNLNIVDKATLECWVQTSGTSAAAFVSKYYSATSQRQIMLGMRPTGEVYTVVTNNGAGTITRETFGGQTINDGEWHHLAYVYDGSAGVSQVYIDGVADVPVTINGSIPTSTTTFNTPVTIGGGWSLPTPTGLAQGLVDEVRIWNTQRTLTQIKDNMCRQLEGNEAGLVGYWNFNEGTGTSAADTQVNVTANNATLY